MRGRAVVVAVALSLTVFAVFGQVAGHDFIEEHDDAKYVTANPHVRAGLTAEGVVWAFTSVGYASNWHPLTWLSHMADVQLFGLDAGRHLVVNLLWHLANVLLLFFVLSAMTGELWPSALTAALFAVHPLNVESVAWVAERKNLLSSALWFLTTGAYVRYVRRPGIRTYLVVPLLLALGLMAKPMLVTLPPVLLLLDRWPLARPLDRRSLLDKAPLFALCAASSLMTLLAQARGTALASFSRLPLEPRISTALTAGAGYLRALAWPVDLSYFYPRVSRALLSEPVLLAAALLLVVTVAALACRRRAPYVLVGWLWYVVTLLPVSGLLQAGSQGRADRYAYVPAVGIVIAVAWGCAALGRHGAALRPARVVGGVAAVALLALTAHAGAARWKDGGTLFGDALRRDPANWMAENDLGLFVQRQGRAGEALVHLRRALAIKPNYTGAMFNLADLERRLGHASEAIRLSRGVLELQPDDEDAHYCLGIVLLQQGRVEEAIVHLREATRLRPDDAEALANLEQALRVQAARTAGRP